MLKNTRKWESGAIVHETFSPRSRVQILTEIKTYLRSEFINLFNGKKNEKIKKAGMIHV